MRQKVFTFGDRFTIRDADGADRYFVQGEVFSWGKKLHVYLPDGAEVAYIKQRVLSLLTRFEVYMGDTLVMEVVKKLSLFRPKYELTMVDWQVEGDFWSHEFRFTRGGIPIASISKAWFTWGDSYEIDIAPGVPELQVLAAVLAIDGAIAIAAQNG
jgi:uncharacterized protein YxjI